MPQVPKRSELRLSTSSLILIVLLPVTIALTEHVPCGFYKRRFIGANQLKIVNSLITNRAAAAARTREAVDFISVGIPDVVLYLVPCLILIADVLQRAKPVLPAAGLREAQRSVILARH